MSRRQDILAAGLPPDTAAFLGGGSAGAATELVKNLPEAQKRVADRVYTESLRTMWIFYVVVAFVGLLCSFAIGKTKLSKIHEVQKQGLAGQEEERRKEEEERRVKRESRRESKRASRLSLGEGRRGEGDGERVGKEESGR